MGSTGSGNSFGRLLRRRRGRRAIRLCRFPVAPPLSQAASGDAVYTQRRTILSFMARVALSLQVANADPNKHATTPKYSGLGAAAAVEPGGGMPTTCSKRFSAFFALALQDGRERQSVQGARLSWDAHSGCPEEGRGGSPQRILQRDLTIAARELLIKLRFGCVSRRSLPECRPVGTTSVAECELKILQALLLCADVDSLNERRKIQRHRRLGLLKNDQLLIDGTHSENKSGPVVCNER